ncbi:MAG: DNA methylase, partial [Clostridia bacterium]|nr:DNA methylase [Clostridia bacterium]
ERAAKDGLLIRRLNIVAENVVREDDMEKTAPKPEQLDLFTDYEKLDRERAEADEALKTEKKMQQALIGIKQKYGKNAILKGVSLKEGATGRERNDQIGGHKA